MDIQTKTDIIHQKIYDFLLYIYPLLTKYPKYEKFSLQTATRNAILEMLQEVIKWDKTATKSHLYTVDTALQESKELLRLAHDLKYSAKDGRRITLLDAMGDYGNVQKAYNKARKCKRHRKDVLIFTKDKEENLDKVREDIINLAYEPSKYHYFKVYEPKERQIMALPFYDRVVQHAINNVLEPIFDKRFISQSYACRKGKGMHAASDTLKEWLYEWNKYHQDQPLYAIKADIHHYFQSIDHAVLKTEIRKVIKDAGVLALLDRIIDHNGNMPDGVGIPVGNLTSQLFANIYLDALDQFIKHELGVEAYIRYMDDFVILSPDKEQLRSWLARIEQFLREELKLEFNPKTTILAAKNGIDFVGYKHRATHRKVRKDSIKRIKRTIKKCESGKITKEQLQKSIQSWTGHAGHADSYNLRKKIETLAEAAIEKAA
jgi:retron-type reverse transcriptase